MGYGCFGAHLFVFPDTAAPNRSYAITVVAIIGGFLFGVGAAVNGGCAFSTLGHLANGVTLLFMRLLTGKTLKVVCTNDICQTEN